MTRPFTGAVQDSQWSKPVIELDEWIEREFAGHGVAIRRGTDPPIPGEPLMSMVDAKELTRAAVAAFAAPAPMTSTPDDARELLALRETIAEMIYYTDFHFSEPGKKPDWLRGGNSLKQAEARRIAAAIISIARAAPPTRRQPECAQVAREIVTDWLGAFDPAPQIDFVQSEMLQAAIVSALRAAAVSPPSEAGRETIREQVAIRAAQIDERWRQAMRELRELLIEGASDPVVKRRVFDLIMFGPGFSPDQGTVAVASAYREAPC